MFCFWKLKVKVCLYIKLFFIMINTKAASTSDLEWTRVNEYISNESERLSLHKPQSVCIWIWYNDSYCEFVIIPIQFISFSFGSCLVWRSQTSTVLGLGVAGLAAGTAPVNEYLILYWIHSTCITFKSPFGLFSFGNAYMALWL